MVQSLPQVCVRTQPPHGRLFKSLKLMLTVEKWTHGGAELILLLGHVRFGQHSGEKTSHLPKMGVVRLDWLVQALVVYELCDPDWVGYHHKLRCDTAFP